MISGREKSPGSGAGALAVARRHWLALLRPLVWAFAVGALAGMAAIVAPESVSRARLFWRGLAGTGILLWLLLSWSAVSEWVATIYVVTPERIFMRRGLLRRQVVEATPSQIGRCSIHQGILGRLLGYGTVRLELRQGSWWTIRRISRPGDFVAGIDSAASGISSGG